MSLLSHSVVVKQYGKAKNINGSFRRKKEGWIAHFEREEQLAFTAFAINKSNDKEYNKKNFKNLATQTVKFALRYKNGKFNFYKVTKTKVTIAHIIDFKKIFSISKFKIQKKYKLPNYIKSNHDDFLVPLTIYKKLYSIIRKFCRRLNVSIKYLSKDPFILINELCYPYKQIYSPNKYINVINGRFFKRDTCKYILNTNGSSSRNWLINLKENLSEYDLEVIRQYRIKFGLDYTKQVFNKYEWGIPFVKTKDKYHKNFFNLPKKIIDTAVKQPVFYTTDTINLINRYPNFDITQYKDIKTLHDDLAIHDLQIKESKRHGPLEIHPTVQTLLDNWSGKYTLVAPKSGIDLINWGKIMYNCVASYIERIRDHQYIIFGIFDGEKLLYNAGFNIINDKLHLSQWSGLRNSRISEDEILILTKQFKEAGGKKCLLN